MSWLSDLSFDVTNPQVGFGLTSDSAILYILLPNLDQTLVNLSRIFPETLYKISEISDVSSSSSHYTLVWVKNFYYLWHNLGDLHYSEWKFQLFARVILVWPIKRRV